jgi:wyosine [tRNA(Phe)-imidazoG37] synthetase (radical SAM superfamily)
MEPARDESSATDTRETMRHVFGPVRSRRLGRSLGVDLVPFKVCPYDCIHCQLGPTTERTRERRRHASVEEVLSEVDRALRAGPAPDHVTLSGSGEPTLHSEIGEVIRGIAALTDVPVAVLTNGSLLGDAAVMEACLQADVVLPTLAADDEATFRRIHRPVPGITLQSVMEGMVEFRSRFSGQLWLEVFLLQGLNTSEEQLRGIRSLADSLYPDRIHLNTAVRPTAARIARPVSVEEMARIRDLFGPTAEVVGEFESAGCAVAPTLEPGAVLRILRRRPCTCQEIAEALCVERAAVAAQFDELLRLGEIVGFEVEGEMFFRVRRPPLQRRRPLPSH